MNVFDLIFWAVAALVLAQLAAGASPRLWLALGAVLGLGLLNKLSPAFFLAGLGVGVLATPLRRHLLRWEAWVGLGLTALLVLPHVVWQIREGWPTLEFIANATREKNLALSPLDFARGQVRELNPLAAPLWMAGLAWLFVARRGAFRVLGIVYVVAFVIFTLQHAKTYYLAPAYPPLFAAGALAVEGLPRLWMRLVPIPLLVGGVLLVAPFCMPVLPVERFIAYQDALGVKPIAAENNELGLLPQHFADRFGWEELTALVAKTWRALPPEEQANAVIVTSNYGQAGALNYYGRRAGLPPAISQHNAFYTWGPGRERLEVAVIVGMRAESLRDAWRECVPVGKPEHPWAMPFERSRPVLVCRGLLLPLDEAWRRGKHFI